MSTRPWMPIYWGDYLADTTHFSTFQHGMYLLMIAAYWRKGGPIENNPELISRIARTSCDKVARYGKPVLAMFSCKDGLLYHQRIENELLSASNRQKSAKANGRAGGLAKSKLVTVTVTDVPLAKANGRSANGHGAKDRDADLRKQCYDRGKEIFGSSAGGTVTNLFKAKGDKPAKVLAMIEEAAEKDRPNDWINAWLWKYGPPGIEVGSLDST